MDSEILESLAGFDALWQRVTGREEPERSAPAQTTYALERALRRLMEEEACAAREAAALAGVSRSAARGTLARQAGDAKRRLRRLRAEYYILTGTAAPGGGDCPAASNGLERLRAAFLQAGRMAEQYRQAARLADGGELSQTLDGFAEEQTVRARQLRALLVERF